MTRSPVAAVLLGACLAALAGWHLLLRGHGRGLPLMTDEGEYAAVARAWSDGGLPYRDAFSQKPPMVFLFYRAASALSDVPEFPRALAALAALATLLTLFFAAPKTWSAQARLAGPAAFASLAALPVGDYSFGANTEVFVSLFSALSVLAALRFQPFAAGLAAGAALCTKQTALYPAAAFGAFLLMTKPRHDDRCVPLYTLGVLAVPAAWAVYFASRGGLGDYWQAAWAGNMQYAAVLAMTSSLTGQLAWFAGVLLPRLTLFCIPALASAAFAFKGLQAGRKTPVETLAVLWLAGSAVGTMTGLFLFPHYFLVLAPPLALAAACGVERLPRRQLKTAAVAVLAAWPALIAPRLFFLAGARERGLTLLYPNPLFETRALGEEIKRRAEPSDLLHVFGSEGALFSYSGLRSATPHTLSYRLTLFPRNRAEVFAELSLLQAAPPHFLVWSTQPLSTMISSSLGLQYRDGLRAFIDGRYDYAGRVRISDAPALPVFETARARQPADFATTDQLILFERRALYGGHRD